MPSVFFSLTRPFGIAFGVFVLVNLALALESPQHSVTHIWLDTRLPEPGISAFAALLGIALLAPHEVAESPRARWLLGGIFLGFALLVGTTAAAYYWELHERRVSSDLPIPLGGFLLLILAAELARVMRWRPVATRVPAPARVFFTTVAVGVAFILINIAYIVSYGHTDFRCPADAAVILGAKVDSTGTPCAALVDRLETGIDTWQEGLVDYLVMSGARGPNGQDEPTVMARYAIARGVPADRIILDRAGFNTQSTAESCRAIAEEWGFTRFLAVTQYFHCARVKLAFDRVNTACHTVPTCSSRRRAADSDGHGVPVRLSRETFFLLREAVAFPFYWLFR